MTLRSLIETHGQARLPSASAHLSIMLARFRLAQMKYFIMTNRLRTVSTLRILVFLAKTFSSQAPQRSLEFAL